MGTASCAMCGKTVDESKLLFSDEGRICGACELELGDREVEANTQWMAAVGGPLMAFTALIFLLTGFVPVIGLVGGALAPLVAIIAIVLAVQAFLKAGEADGPLRTLMIVGAALTLPVSLGVLVLGVLLVLTQLLALAQL